MKILNFGSLNIDLVYRVPHIVRPGETISGTAFRTFAGGKGANQSMALARAGAPVYHAGKVGKDGRWLVKKLRDAGVNTSLIRVTDDPSGHAVIQVDDAGENAIFLFPGTNRQIARNEIGTALASCRAGDLVLLQNEINDIPAIIRQARRRKLRVCLNPAPMEPAVLRYPLDLVDILIVNETEAAGLAGSQRPGGVLDDLAKKLPRAEIVLTLGARGAVVRTPEQEIRVPAVKVKAVDTTAAGDCFIGYYLAGRARGEGIESCLRTACLAAAVSVTRPGAMDSIPAAAELRARMGREVGTASRSRRGRPRGASFTSPFRG